MTTQSANTTQPGTGSLATYLSGYVLALVLTIVPFALVMSGVLSWTATVVAIFVAAVVQVLVHLHYFLHLDRSSEQRWNVLALVFTGLIVLILVGGSVWIMFSLHARTHHTGRAGVARSQRVILEQEGGPHTQKPELTRLNRNVFNTKEPRWLDRSTGWPLIGVGWNVFTRHGRRFSKSAPHGWNNSDVMALPPNGWPKISSRISSPEFWTGRSPI